ncbi:patatin-like phospholipase family protein [Rhodoferax antarcticus]|uniref:patatin-like phospholipase family protein n=1 Tax=Rhodoferax antarcticus TaxID=81479 RepID=UPI002225B215|nr:patatin-like phospholipase family protein [Rhodoferax antarcticus]MCW2312139.1 NTE family protein [Rhodoferax antarcticus]
MPLYPATPSAAPPAAETTAALMLSGGGARAAYQVGVLEAISELRRACGAQNQPNPFPIISGTSAGAINAASLACGADQFDEAVRRIAHVWRNFRADQVYRADSVSMLRSGAKWMTLLSMGWMIAKWRRVKPKSLLDNSPLAELLTKMVPLDRIPMLIRDGHLQALAVTASSYTSGEHFTFYEGDKRLLPWTRSQRRGLRDKITHEHLLASSAIPFVFPAMPLHVDGETAYYGDGSMRQSAPMAPAIHLGAQRILVIGAGRVHASKKPGSVGDSGDYPSLAQIAGHALANIFLDALAVDIERIRRINQTLNLVPPDMRAASNLRPVDLLLISPSERLDVIAARHVHELPAPVRRVLGSLGVSSHVSDEHGAPLASYLLFEPGYTGELMALGHKDAMRQRAEICAFFDWTDPQAAPKADPGATVPAPAYQERRRDPLRLR